MQKQTVPNQKIIQVNKEIIGRNNLYTTISLKGINEAATLPNNAFKLWLYLAMNQDKFSFPLSCKAFCQFAGCTKSTYEKAVKALIENGYLIQKHDGSNIYQFYEVSQLDDTLIIENQREAVERNNNL